MTIVYLNDEAITITKDNTLFQLLSEKGYADNGFAVMLNHYFVPRSYYTKKILADGDVIHIIAPMQGG